jgi:hypothetical protein
VLSALRQSARHMMQLSLVDLTDDIPTVEQTVVGLTDGTSTEEQTADLLNLTDDALLTLAFVIGEDRLPAERHRKALRWDSPVTGAAANLNALSCTCRALHQLISPNLGLLRAKILEQLKRETCAQLRHEWSVCMSEDTLLRVSEDTLLLWRSALLENGARTEQQTWRPDASRRRCGTSPEERARQSQAAAAAVTEREIAAMHLPGSSALRRPGSARGRAVAASPRLSMGRVLHVC